MPLYRAADTRDKSWGEAKRGISRVGALEGARIQNLGEVTLEASAVKPEQRHYGSLAHPKDQDTRDRPWPGSEASWCQEKAKRGADY